MVREQRSESMPNCTSRWISTHARTRPGAIALHPEPHHGVPPRAGTTPTTGLPPLDWQDLQRLARRIAARLQAVRDAPGTVLIETSHPPTTLLWILGARHADWTVALSNARWSEAERRAWQTTVEPHAVLPEGAGGGGAHRWNEIADHPVDLATYEAASSRAGAALIMPTSGTSGRPRGVMLPDAAVQANARQFGERLALGADTRYLALAPLFHAAGLHVLTLPTLRAGGTVLLPNAFRPETALAALPLATHTVLVPTLWHRLVEAGLNETHTSGLRVAISGGAPIAASLHQSLLERGVPLAHGYGLTEACAMVSLHLPEAGSRPPRPSDVGPPGTGTTIRVLGARDPWSPGRILIRGPQIMQGYLNAPEATAESFRDGYLDTGDAGWLDERGHLHVVGRMDDMIISGGENVFPAPVEAAIEEEPGVRRCAVVGAPDAHWGQRVVACIEPDGVPPSLQALRDALRDRVAAFALPRELVVLDAFPLLGSGKVDRRALMQRLPGQQVAS